MQHAFGVTARRSAIKTRANADLCLYDACRFCVRGRLAGDLNATQEYDKHLHTDNRLKDAYLERGGQEDDAEAGHTWGQQAAPAARERFGTTRMDKTYFCGSVKCTLVESFGADVQVDNEDERKQIVDLGVEKPWVTDHLGVHAIFELSD